MKKAVWLLTVGLLASGVAGCVAQVQTTRKQKAFYETPENRPEAKIALVSIQLPERIQKSAPDEDPPAQRLRAAIPKAFDGSDYTVVDETSSNFTLEIGPDTESDSSSSIDRNKTFAADKPEDVPADIEAPLILGVRVLDWSERKKGHRGQTLRLANTDVVYSLWTRDGKHVDTRRVRLSLLPGQGTQTAVRLLPNRPIRIQRAWEKAKDAYIEFASEDESRLFETAARVSARAFAFPFASHQVHFRAQLASGDGLDPGLEKMKQEDWEGAYREFKKVAERKEDADGAYYNMGVVRELQGRTADAIEHYKKAISIEEKRLYTRQLGAARHRHETDRQLVLPELPDASTDGPTDTPGKSGSEEAESAPGSGAEEAGKESPDERDDSSSKK